jgi:hypothetical protein
MAGLSPPPQTQAPVGKRGFVSRWFSVYPAAELGDDDAYSELGSVIALVAGTAAGFALIVNQVSGSWIVTSLFYVLITLGICFHVWLIINSTKDGLLRHKGASIIYGNVLIGGTLLASGLLVVLAWYGAFPGQTPKRRDYTGRDIKWEEPILASNFRLTVTPGGRFRDTAQQQLRDTEAFQQWMAPTITNPEEEQVIILRQSGGFDDAYNPFTAVLLHDSNVTIKDMLVLLRREPKESPNTLLFRKLGWQMSTHDDLEGLYEVLHLPRDSGGQVYPVITIPAPNERDSILLFVRVVPFVNPMKPEEKVKLNTTDPMWFNLRLWRI